MPGVVPAAEAVVNHFLLLKPHPDSFPVGPVSAAVPAEPLFELVRDWHAGFLRQSAGLADVTVGKPLVALTTSF